MQWLTAAAPAALAFPALQIPLTNDLKFAVFAVKFLDFGPHDQAISWILTTLKGCENTNEFLTSVLMRQNPTRHNSHFTLAADVPASCPCWPDDRCSMVLDANLNQKLRLLVPSQVVKTGARNQMKLGLAAMNVLHPVSVEKGILFQHDANVFVPLLNISGGVEFNGIGGVGM